MNNILYQRTIVTAVNSKDGETPTQILVTQENNGTAVWINSYDANELIHFERFSRDDAITFAVNYANNAIARAKGEI